MSHRNSKKNTLYEKWLFSKIETKPNRNSEENYV